MDINEEKKQIKSYDLNDQDNDKERKAYDCPPINAQTDKDRKTDAIIQEESIPITGDVNSPQKMHRLLLASDKLFRSKAEEAGIVVDNDGILIDKKSEAEYVSNIKKIEFLYTVISGTDSANRVRVVKINDTITELHPEHLTSLSSFKKLLLGKGNISFNGEATLFKKLVNLILELDNGKIVEKYEGFGRVHPNIYHLGNQIIISGKTKPYQELIWSGNKGFKLEKTGKLRIDPHSYMIADIWAKLNQTYAEYTYIITGFAVATIFFDAIINIYGCFPILYISGKSGSGKTKMAEIISNMLGCDTDLFTVNCDSLSTQTGVDEKNQSLNNLPLILNEVYYKWFSLLKSRFEGGGAIKADSTKQKRVMQRQVKGSTIVTSVNRPVDSQVISRSAFVDTSKMERNHEKFKDLYHNRRRLSRFIVSALEINKEFVVAEIKSFYDVLEIEHIEPRIISNYAIIAGALSSFITENKITDCDKDKLIAFFKNEMIEAEKGLNPVYHLICEIRLLIEEKPDQDFLTYDDEFVYIHVEGFWQFLSLAFKDQYYRKLEAKDIKQMFANSEYVVRYGAQFDGPNDKPVISHVKKIGNVNKRCVILKRKKL